jgi:probable selenium-dependent hydroxylase accessory protein YqeC
MTYLFTFANTHYSIISEKILLEAGIKATVMPLPGAIQSGCGICLRVQEEELLPSSRLLQKEQVEYRVYQIIEQEGKKGFRLYLDGKLVNAVSVQEHDIISIVGCGGKTSCMYQLARELKKEKVLVTTTTNIMIPDKEEGTVDFILDGSTCTSLTKENITRGRYLVYGSLTPANKCKSLMEEEILKLSELFTVTLIEADGSKGLPIKGYRDYEPCTPSFATLTIGVLPLWSIGASISEATVHRVDEYCKMTGSKRNDKITLEQMGRWLAHPDGMFKGSNGRKVLFLNQVEDEEMRKKAKKLMDCIPKALWNDLERVIMGSIHEGVYHQLK